MDSFKSYPRMQASSIANVDVNWGPRSEIRQSCSPKWRKTCLKNNPATPLVSMSLLYRVRITPFERPWLTMTMSESKPWDGRRPVMRSTDSCWKGHVQVEERGDRAGAVG